MILYQYQDLVLIVGQNRTAKAYDSPRATKCHLANFSNLRTVDAKARGKSDRLMMVGAGGFPSPQRSAVDVRGGGRAASVGHETPYPRVAVGALPTAYPASFPAN
jgi:hypothetical protein